MPRIGIGISPGDFTILTPGPAPPASFVPTSLANLIGWYDAQAGGRIHLDGIGSPQGVLQWDDRSASANNAIDNSGGTTLPAYLATGLNGLPGLETLNGSQAGTGGLDTTTQTALGTNPALSLFIVGAVTQTAASGSVLTTNQIQMGLLNTDEEIYGIVGGNRLQLASQWVTNAVEVRAARRPAGATQSWKAWRNGNNLLGTGTAASIGTAQTQATILNAFPGIVGELLIYQRALTDPEMIQVWTYLGAKWGVTIT